jgi:hypothetical protein
MSNKLSDSAVLALLIGVVILFFAAYYLIYIAG